MDNCKGCVIFIAPSAGSVFLRNCKDCTVYTVSQQLRWACLLAVAGPLLMSRVPSWWLIQSFPVEPRSRSTKQTRSKENSLKECVDIRASVFTLTAPALEDCAELLFSPLDLATVTYPEFKGGPFPVLPIVLNMLTEMPCKAPCTLT